MAIAGIDPKCYILALFVRDDGVRFLLGDDPYEFKDKQLHFQPNTVANDVVEVQGNDGYLLAGQVRRPGTQSFDGYVCNGTNSKAEVEVKRREFLQFFRRSHFYKVIYVFPNGTAIQRKQGFLVDDPTVQELYQQYPEYHVALNFEDVNYYTYEEDDQGQEIYAKEAIVPLAGGGATGGLIWDEYGVVWEDPWSDLVSVSGSEIQINNEAGARAPIQDLGLRGDTEQQTYSGKNIFPDDAITPGTTNGITFANNNGIFSISGTASANAERPLYVNLDTIPASLIENGVSYTISTNKPLPSGVILAIMSYENSSWRSDIIVLNGNGSRLSVTRTSNIPSTVNRIRYNFRVNSRTTVNLSGLTIQLEKNSTATTYEPYVGGIPAPNPDYPQEVQTVTGEQTIVVTGKNMFNIQEVVKGRIDNGDIGYASGTSSLTLDANSFTFTTNASYRGVTSGFIQVTPNLTYKLSYSGLTGGCYVDYYQDKTNWISRGGVSTSSPSFTVPDGCHYIRVSWQRITAGTTTISNPQLEIGSEATAYEPYQGQSYSISLEAIELCKIGDYQDYIYKSGDDWYVHKAINKQVVDSGGLGIVTSYASLDYADYNKPTDSIYYNNYNEFLNVPMFFTNATHGDPVGGFDNVDWIGKLFLSPKKDKYWIGFEKGTTLANMQNSLNGAMLYYPLATPTDTQITDATLVGQLDTLGAMKLFIGENNLLVSATGSNLPATLEFSYPTKFAAIGAEWEEGGTKGATIVDVNAIDNTYPVWELMGPAVNPTISALTTNTTLTYNGTITASQKLVIDMFNKTATLNGTSVIGNVSGDFVYMAPGTNRIAYTAGNTDAPDSTIYWQEVVG